MKYEISATLHYQKERIRDLINLRFNSCSLPSIDKLRLVNSKHYLLISEDINLREFKLLQLQQIILQHSGDSKRL